MVANKWGATSLFYGFKIGCEINGLRATFEMDSLTNVNVEYFGMFTLKFTFNHLANAIIQSDLYICILGSMYPCHALTL